MFVQTQTTPNPNSLKFLPGKTVSNSGSYEIKKKNSVKNDLVRNILSINGVTSVFLGSDFISVNKQKDISWEDIKHIVVSLINEYYESGNKFVIDKSLLENKKKENLIDIEKQIIQILDTKIRPAVARDGGDIKFEEYKEGIVKVRLQGSCSGCPSSTMTLKQGVQNLLCHYVKDVKEVIAI
jgi:Fe-S cluster biogenesis protein NfuA|tara:strand:- start:578 stop:1123 length:546 start_codon:yes stop_codon:yes gene_type:complete